MATLKEIRTHRRLFNSTASEALKAIKEGWSAPQLNHRGEPVMSIEEATADHVAMIRKSFYEKGLVALEYRADACGCQGPSEGMPACPCKLRYYAYSVVRDEADAYLKNAGIIS